MISGKYVARTERKVRKFETSDEIRAMDPEKPFRQKSDLWVKEKILEALAMADSKAGDLEKWRYAQYAIQLDPTLEFAAGGGPSPDIAAMRRLVGGTAALEAKGRTPGNRKSPAGKDPGRSRGGPIIKSRIPGWKPKEG